MKIDKVKGIVEEERFEYRGFPCVVLFMSMGHRCGYVGIHKDLMKPIDIDEIECHGGITYGPDNYLALQNDTDISWIGFDTAHCCDRQDVAKVIEYFGEDVILFDGLGEAIRTLEYCKQECMKIVDQVIDILKIDEEE